MEWPKITRGKIHFSSVKGTYRGAQLSRNNLLTTVTLS